MSVKEEPTPSYFSTTMSWQRAPDDTFSPSDGEWTYEDTEFYITLDVPIQVEDATLSITGLETEHPLLKVNSTLLRGTHANLVASEIILKHNKPIGFTSQRIEFKPIHQTDEQQQQPAQQESEDDKPLAQDRDDTQREELVRKVEKSIRKAARKKRRELEREENE